MIRSVRTLLVVVLLASSAFPQEPPPIHSEVREVQVPIVVIDSRGHRVSGLKQSDFQISEDGLVQRIVSFRTTSEPEESTRSQPGDPRRTYLILIDTLHSSFANFGHVRDALRKFFENTRSADAQYAVMALGRQLKVLHDSTREPASVLAALRGAAFTSAVQDSEAANLATAMDQFTRLVRNYCAVCRCAAAGDTTDDPGCAAAKSRVQMFLTSSSETTYLLDRQFLRELSEVVNAIASMPTSRTVILISDGFNRFSGRELYDIFMNYGPADRSFAFTPRDTRPDFDAVLKIATKDNVKFYTIDSRGLYTAASTPGSGFDASSSVSVHTQMDSRTSANLAAGVPQSVLSPARENTDALAELARQTGGLFFENNNETLKGIQQAVADARESYVLAYVPENKAGDGKYRSIAVTVRGGKWKVVAKPGYWSAAK